MGILIFPEGSERVEAQQQDRNSDETGQDMPLGKKGKKRVHGNTSVVDLTHGFRVWFFTLA
jgi:hypothetical protein